MGDSHTLVFQSGGEMHALNAGLSAALTTALNTPVDLMGKKGSAATSVRIDLYRKAKRDPEFLTSKKAVIWCFAGRELTASKWKQLPVAP